MTTYRVLVAGLALATVLGLPAAAGAQERMKHSGSIVAVDREAETIVLAEIGPWKLRNGELVVTYRTITVTPETEITLADRDYGTTDGWPGAFVEGPLGAEALYPNAFVTIDCLHRGRELIALKITVTAMP